MPYRSYVVNQRYIKNKRGDIGYYKKIIKKWIESNKPYKRQKRGWEKQSIYSIRFGLLELYNRKEQQQLICPTGYSISQCFNILRKMWYAYHKSRHDEKDYDKMVKYAKAIQNVQKDMGIKTTSFPHLRIYGDVLVLKNTSGELIVEDHSILKKNQEKRKRRMARMSKAVRMSKMIQQKLLRPDKNKGEKITTFADNFGPSFIDREQLEVAVPQLLHADQEAGEKIMCFPDNIPFRVTRPRYSKGIQQEPRRPHRRRVKKIQSSKMIQQKLLRPDKNKGEKITTFADNFGPSFIDLEEHEPVVPDFIDLEEHESIVPDLLEANVEAGEKTVCFPDNIPFRDVNRLGNSNAIDQNLRPHRRRREKIITFADDVSPYQMLKNVRENVVPYLNEPNEKKGEKRVVFPDDTPFEN